MSALTVAETISFDADPLTEEHVKEILVQSLKKDFDKVKIKKTNGDEFLRCRVKTKVLNPIVTVSGPLKIQVKGKKAKILIDGDTKTNGWFWSTFTIALLLLVAGGAGIILYIMMFFMYSSQKKKSTEAFSNAFSRIKFESDEL